MLKIIFFKKNNHLKENNFCRYRKHPLGNTAVIQNQKHKERKSSLLSYSSASDHYLTSNQVRKKFFVSFFI